METIENKDDHLIDDGARWDDNCDPLKDMINGIALTSGLTVDEVTSRLIYDNDGKLDVLRTACNCSSLEFIRKTASKETE